MEDNKSYEMSIEQLETLVKNSTNDSVAKHLEQVKKEFDANVKSTVAALLEEQVDAVHGYKDHKEKMHTFIGRGLKALMKYSNAKRKGTTNETAAEFNAKFVEQYKNTDKEYYVSAKSILSGEGDGGILITEEWASYFIDELYNATFMSEVGLRREVINDRYRIPVVTDGILASFVGEFEEIEADKLNLAEIAMEPKTLKSMALISNYLLETNSYAADRMITQNMLRNIQIVLETAFLYGDGGKEPIGAKNVAGKLELGNATTDLSRSQLIKAIALKGKKNYDPRDGVFVMNWEAWEVLQNEVQANGNLVNAAEMANGRIAGGFRFVVSNIVAAGEMFFLHGRDIIFAEKDSVETSVSTEASVKFANKTLNMWAAGVTGMQAITRFDFGYAHPEAVLVLTYKPVAA